MARPQDPLVRRLGDAFEALSDSSSLLELLLEQSGIGIILADADGTMRAFNPEAEAQHGKGFESLPANEWIDTYGLCQLDGTKCELADLALYRALQGEQQAAFSYLVRHPDGRARVISGHANPLRLADGRLAGAVVISHDDTERHHAEQRSAAARQDLERSERLTRRLLDNSSDVLLFLDTDGKVVWQNPRAASFLGLGAVTDLERTLFVELWQPSSAAAAGAHFAKVVGGEEGSFIGQTRAHHGVAQWWSARLTADDDLVDGRPGIFVSMRDITQLKRVEAETRAQARFAQQLIGIVSHDLRNPISAILLCVAQLRRHTAGDARLARVADRIGWAAQRANRLIYDLLDFTQSRLGGGLKVRPVLCDVAEMARRTVEEIAEQNPGRAIHLRLSGDTRAEVDLDRLAQILVNLTNNAVQYGPEDAAIVVTLGGDAEQLVLAVNNAGPLIPQGTLGMLFEPLQRGGASGSKTRSIGLGLYIVRCIADAHTGRVGAESSREAGNTFTVRLPRRQPAAAVADPAHGRPA